MVAGDVPVILLGVRGDLDLEGVLLLKYYVPDCIPRNLLGLNPTRARKVREK